MDSRLIPLAQSCNHWFVVDDAVVMVNSNLMFEIL